MKRNSYNVIKKGLALILSLVMTCLVGVTDAYAAGVAKPNAKITEENILSILEKYDKEGYLFLSETKKNNGDFMAWWMAAVSIVDVMDVGVHEECHHYTKVSNDFSTKGYITRYHVDEGLDVNVPWKMESVFYSYEMGKTLPSSLRFFRFDRYIGESSSENQSANKYGPYGLLDEFNAYGWGLYDNLCMYKYLCDNKNKKYAKNFLDSSALSNIEAYAEFKLWIYSYLLYAKNNYPDVYASIVNNTEFIRAYVAIDNRINRSIDEYVKIAGKKSLKKSAYKKVNKELKKTEYKEIKAVLGGSKVNVDVPIQNDDCGWSTIGYLREVDDGIKLGWNRATNSDGTLIYRKEEGGSFTEIKDAKNEGSAQYLAYIDKDTQSGKTYTYYVAPYKMIGNERVFGKESIKHTITTYPQVQVKSVSYSNGEFTVKWKSQSVFDGYEIRQLVKSAPIIIENGNKIENSNETSSYADKGSTSLTFDADLGKGTYQISVRGYVERDGVMSYAKWSEIKTIEV